VFGVSVDSWATLKKYREELNLPFDLLSDWDREASKKYGTFNEREGVANRKSFLIDRKGMVRFIQESGLEEPRKHEDMLAAVKKLRQRGQPGPAAAGEAAGPVDAVFYEFYSETCEHCKKMKPVVEEFRKKHEKRFGKFLLIPFKGSGNISLFHEYNITGTPTFIITDAAGKEIDRISGVVSLEALVTFMENSFRRMRKR
jgi:thiol-disulfide isomerase/thioredoxin